MSLMEHFADLRHSLAYGLGGVALCFVVSLFFFEALSELIIGPLLSALERLNLEQSVKFRTVQGGFFFHIKIAMLSAFVFGMPVLTYQVWRFIAPAKPLPWVVPTTSTFWPATKWLGARVEPTSTTASSDTRNSATLDFGSTFALAK